MRSCGSGRKVLRSGYGSGVTVPGGQVEGAILRSLLGMLVGLAAFLAATQALACRVFPQPTAVMRSAEGAVVVSVVSARPVGKMAQWQPWSADGRVLRVIAGQPRAQVFNFRNYGSTASCDEPAAVPRRGDRWVLYLWKGSKGEWLVGHHYPLKKMLSVDDRLAEFR
jgi:hypothetical protein